MKIFLLIIKRILLLFPILIGISLVTFVITHVLPGDPIYVILSPYAKEDDIQKARHDLGLDRPVFVQYGYYVKDLVQGDLGTSYRSKQPVLDEIKMRFPATFELTTISIILTCLIGIPAGVQAAVHKDSPFDHFIRVVSVGGVSIPVFLTGIVLVFIFYYLLKIAPPPLGRISSSIQPPKTITGMYILDALLTRNLTALKSSISFIVLPSITLMIAMVAPVMRITRNSILEIVNSNFIRTVYALGIPENKVLYHDVLKNALLPIITAIGQIYGWSLGGEVLVEVVFSWPGMGQYAVNSILNLDYSPVQGFVLVTATIYVLIYLLVDLAYILIDPRIS